MAPYGDKDIFSLYILDLSLEKYKSTNEQQYFMIQYFIIVTLKSGSKNEYNFIEIYHFQPF